MADQPPGKRAGQRNRSGLCQYSFLTVLTDRVGGERAGRVQEYIVHPRVVRGADAGRERLMRRKREIQLEEAGVSYHLGWKFPSQRGQPCGSSKHDSPVGGLIVAVVQRALSGLRNDLRASIQKAHDRGNVKDVLVESAKEKCSVVADRTTQREAELLLLRVWLEIQERLHRSECTVSNEIKIGSVDLIRSRFRDYVDHRASGPSQLRSIGIRRDSELLHNFVRELIG